MAALGATGAQMARLGTAARVPGFAHFITLEQHAEMTREADASENDQRSTSETKA